VSLQRDPPHAGYAKTAGRLTTHLADNTLGGHGADLGVHPGVDLRAPLSGGDVRLVEMGDIDLGWHDQIGFGVTERGRTRGLSWPHARTFAWPRTGQVGNRDPVEHP
jgi:hypothetical protein